MGAQQQQINYGAAVNDGQGDPLRTAFIKTDDNFDAIWAAGPVGSNIVISNNNITATNTNGDLRLGTNGTGNIRALRHVIPTGNRLYDLGAANLRFGTVYANSLDVVNFGISTLSVNVIQSDDSAFVLVNDGLEVNGNIAANSIFTTSIQSSDSSMVTINDGLDVNGNVSAAYFVGDGSQLTNLPTVSTYSNANVTAFLGSGLNTSIIPAANATYSLGDASHYWSNLWVAANTIYIGGVALGVSGNVLTVAGEPVLSNDSATDITTTGNIAAQEITATGDFTGGNVEIRTAQLRLAPAASQSTLSLRPDGAIGVAGIDLPNNATANTVDLTVENNSGNVRIKSAALDGWLFDTNGDLTVPNYINFAGNTFIGDEPGGGSPMFRIVAPLTYGATIETDADIEGNSWTWTFGADGVLGAPGNITATNFIGNGSQLTGLANGRAIVNGTSQIDIPTANGNIYVGVNNVGSTEFTALGINTLTLAALANITAAGTITATGNISGGNIITTGNVSATRLQNDANLEIRSGVAGTARTWTFDTLGDLNLPVGGNISGSGGISANNITLTGNISANTAGYAIGYRDIPQVSFTGNATMAATDAGKHFYSTESTDYVLTIADNSAVSWPVGTAITVVNRGTGNITVAQASGVSLYLAGNSTAGNRTVTTYGMVTLLNVAANVWMINGTGVS